MSNYVVQVTLYFISVPFQVGCYCVLAMGVG